MIKYIAVCPETFEKCTKHHLALMRIEFDRVRTFTEQYDLCAQARLFYADRPEVRAMENDLKYSEKPKF